MKRSPMPPRQVPLSTTTPLRRTGPPAPVSAKRSREREAAQPVIDAVFARDGGCVAARRPDLFGPCFGRRFTPHHIVKAWKGVGWTLDGLVTLCAGHNGHVEDHPDVAHPVGLVAREGETLSDAWERMRSAGLVDGRAA